jgi:hypothetical protein
MRAFAGGLLALFALIAPAASAHGTPAEWITISVGSLLTIKAPPGTQFQARPGADSFLGIIVGKGFELELDYGVYSDPLTDRSRFATYSAQSIRIDGKPATIVRATPAGHSTDQGGFIGLHVRQLGQSMLGSLSVTITAVVSNAEQEQLIRQIFESIRFTF